MYSFKIQNSMKSQKKKKIIKRVLKVIVMKKFQLSNLLWIQLRKNFFVSL